MNWINENLQILATLGSALAVYVFLRMGARKDNERLEKRIDKIDITLESMKKDIQQLDSRISRIEGQIQASYYFEPKIKSKKEKQ